MGKYPIALSRLSAVFIQRLYPEIATPSGNSALQLRSAMEECDSAFFCPWLLAALPCLLLGGCIQSQRVDKRAQAVPSAEYYPLFDSLVKPMLQE